MKACHHSALLLAGALVLLLLSAAPAGATDQYAARTGKGCIFCHQESAGGQLKTVGFAYIRNGYRYPIPERILEKSESLQTPFHKTLRFIVGYIHLLAAVIFFGAVFYIHIFIGPRQLKGGIPKPERILGVTCMAVLALTGGYLTWIRLDRWEQFFNNTFGLMLFVKILLFAAMAAIGVTAITLIHRRMAQEAKAEGTPSEAGGLTRTALARFDGAGGRAGYVAYEGKVFDVSASAKWKDGRHFGRHAAGTDLTDALSGAPHGPEVLERVKVVGELQETGEGTPAQGAARRIFVRMAYTNLVIIFLILGCISVWRWDFPLRFIPEARPEALAGTTCLACHREKTPGIYHDWRNGLHSVVGVDCYKCHRAPPSGEFASIAHLRHDPNPILAVVTPHRCAECHPAEAAQYAGSKHAHTHEIVWRVDHWLNEGLNNEIERATGCYACHGTVVKMNEGRPVQGTWPNVGVGRINPDGSLGSCSSCHTRHRFSVEEARKPEACDQCHLGPDHPQIEIYNESKHGTIYHAEGAEWEWRPEDGRWTAGRDFRAPTCAACHMSAAGGVPRSHDVTERLAWETQAPFTVRPEEFQPFPAGTDWKREREKMKRVCLQCHSSDWAERHFENLDRVVRNYNDLYYRPVRLLMDDLYEAGLLGKEAYFDEPLEWEFYEFWHHEGRRARMGAAMMAPDYAWWHGFYELKHRFEVIGSHAAKLQKAGERALYPQVPGRFTP